ncbi:MAG: hypothetical protein LBE55_04870 [Clostridiales bacterium]|jgi:hypothetical protein|nr:hypothetical protein [Clostridiales bacterium]
MKNRLKRILASVLAMLFVWGAWPTALIANDQLPVNNLWIVHQTPLSSQNYTFRLQWGRPLPAGVPLTAPGNFLGSPNNPGGLATSVLDAAGIAQAHAAWLQHRATNYSVMRRDASYWPPATSTWVNVGEVSTIENSPSFQYVNNNLPSVERMRNGRIYGFRIDARHYHRFEAIPPLIGHTEFPISAQGSTEALFLTDLEVMARGEGNELTVEWSRPTLDGNVDPFTGYRIFFAPGGAAVTNIFAQNSETVTIGDPRLTIDGDMYRFTFTTAPGTLIPGAMFAVAVEPMIGNATRRTVPSLRDAFTPRGDLHYTMNEYRTNSAFIRPRFIYTPVGLNLLQLSWDTPMDAQRVELWMRPDNVDAAALLGSISGTATQVINYWLTQRPNIVTYFYLRIYRDGIEVEELVLRYDPSITPFSPTRPNILHIDHEPKPAVQPITLNIMWEAFHRVPYTDADRQDFDNMVGSGDAARYFDPYVQFEVFITDDLDTLSSLSVFGDQQVAILTPEQLGRFLHNCDDHDPIWAHEYEFELFWDSTAEELRPIEANKVYYVRINTRRTAISTWQTSWPAYGAHFVPGYVDVRPLIVPAPPLRIHDEDLDNITIAWEQTWLEVFDADEFVWHTRIAVRGGSLVFGNDILATDTAIPPLHTFANAAALEDYLFNQHGGMVVPVRTQRLADYMGYEIHVRPFAAISEAMSPPPEDAFDIFVEDLHNTPGAWTIIDPEQEEGDNTMYYTIENLEPNTTYAIFFRPFNPRLENTPERNAWWPTLLLGTTTAERDEIDIIPTVPILTPDTAGDVWLRFGLRPYTNPPLRYEFRISEFADFETAWELEPIREDMFARDGHQWRRFAATQLFPETTYYIWARAVGTAADGSYRYSLWSNPIAMQTTPIMIPDPPRGLGIASQHDVHIINLENETDLSPVEPNAMIITWLPHPGDTNMPIDMQDGAMGTEILGSPNILHSYLVRFPELAANRPYYVRARTIYSIHREGISGPVTDIRFNYVVQMATNPQFADATTVFVLPDSYQIQHGVNTRMAMSAWTQTFIFHTARDDGEFDGDVVPELFPLPMHDFEIIYTAATQTLSFRFRSTGVDADGNQDNLVDQRFISRLIQQRVFDYAIDMTHYNNLPVRNRVVELPYSIITAFDERQISFSVTAGDTRYSLSPGFADTPQNIGFNVNSRLRLYINDIIEEDVPTLPDGQNYVVAPQNVAINVTTANNHANERIQLTTLGAPLNVAHSVNQAAMLDANIGSFAMTQDDVNWRRMPTTFNDVAGTLNFATNRPADFTAIAAGVPLQVGTVSPVVRDALYFVNSQMAFEDMDWFAEDNPINAWQINRTISAIARNQDTVAINTDLTAAQMSSLSNSGMLVPGAETVTREAAISSLVRLYEVRTRSRVVGHPTLETSSFADMDTVTAARQQNMLKAEFLGFIDGPMVNPHGHLTMGDAMIIFEIILRN